MTARPLEEFTLAPAAPASARNRSSAPKLSANAAPTMNAALAASPTVITIRSPKRSAARPHGSRASVVPTHSDASSTPISPSDSEYSSRSVGTRTGSPMTSAEMLAVENVPAARTAHRYGGRSTARRG